MTAQHFPPAKIPPSALLDSSFFGTVEKTAIPSILDVKNSIFTTSGRASIALALADAQITPQDEILIPAYHCEAMVAPAKWRQSKIVFYRIKSDTKVDLKDVETKITSNTRVIIVTHYFGFEQDLQPIKKLCIEHNIILIEDCAHAMFGLSSGQPIGTTGDYAIGSCMKFLPIYEGGMLCSSNRNLKSIELTKPSLRFQAKSTVNALETSLKFHRLGSFGRLINFLLKIKDTLWQTIKRTGISSNESLGPSSSDGGFGLDEAWIYKSMSYFSYWILRHAPMDEIAEKRRNNYQAIQTALADLPNCRVLFENLPEHTVPWVFPVYVKHPEKYFPLLKMQGIPVWRFAEFLDPAITPEVCAVSIEYSKHIFQFPCHQSLQPDELDWMLNEIKHIFTK
ncbi:MAG: hypothetical protein CTY19_03235 [Methylomonas sp.]|nr:MAG: hypothetical protein CTY19_03235 [Methylomonas sp.]